MGDMLSELVEHNPELNKTSFTKTRVLCMENIDSIHPLLPEIYKKYKLRQK